MNLKELIEKRNAKIAELDAIIKTAETEKRSLNADEATKFDSTQEEIRLLDASIKAIESRRKIGGNEPSLDPTESEKRALEEKNFLDFVKGNTRALDVANNGGIIPTHIANKIIETVKDLSPIYRLATVYNVGGDLVFPVYDETTPIAANYVDDLTELNEQTGKFTTVKLQNFIVGCLAKISKSLMNRTDFDLLGFVIRKVSEAIAEFLEKECLVGTTNKMTGVLSTTNTVTAAASTAVTADELIDLQDTLPDQLQDGAVWIMNKATRRAIRKLKNDDGEYLLNKDLTTPFGYSLLGKPVYTSKNMPAMAASNKAIVYGDMSGLYIKLAQNVEIQVLQEKYATQHALGVVGYIEADSKIVEPQKLAALVMKAAG